MCCIFFPTDENEVLGEMSCLVSSEFFFISKEFKMILCQSADYQAYSKDETENNTGFCM